VGRDVSRDKGGDQAAWRDLVARLELPSTIDPANIPWPDRENLTHSSGADRQADSASGASEQDDGDPGARTGRHARPGPADTPDDARHAGGGHPPRVSGPAHGSHQTDALQAHGSRQGDAISADSSGGADADQTPGRTRSGQDDPGRGAGSSQIHGQDDADHPGRSAQVRGHIIRPASFVRDPDAGDPDRVPAAPEHDLDVPTSPDLGILDFLDQEDDPSDPDNQYIPPPVPPLPTVDPVAKGAWLALFGGPCYLLLGTILNWNISGWSELLAVAAFITGFVILVARMGDGPSRRDGPDQGAVV
jgi:hypothetical protein